MSKYFNCLPHELLDVNFEDIQIDNLCMLTGLQIEKEQVKKHGK